MPCAARGRGSALARTVYVERMQLTRERIVTAAVDLIEQAGAEAVSMRRIAAELGCGVMSLYNHVPSKAALLDHVADRVMSGIDFSTVPGASWEDQVRAQAQAFRQIARAYPRCTMLVVGRPATSPTRLRPVEHALATLHEAGFGGTEAVQIVRAFVAYIMGSLLREVGVSPSPGLAAGGVGQSADDCARPLPGPPGFPQVSYLAAELTQQDHDADFEFGLDLLVHAVAALRPADQRG